MLSIAVVMVQQMGEHRVLASLRLDVGDGLDQTAEHVVASQAEYEVDADGRTAPRCRGKIDNSDPRTPLRNRIVGERLQTLAGLPNSPEIRYCPRQIQVHPRNPGYGGSVGAQLLQQKDEVILLYPANQQVRRVRIERATCRESGAVGLG